LKAYLNAGLTDFSLTMLTWTARGRIRMKIELSALEARVIAV